MNKKAYNKLMRNLYKKAGVEGEMASYILSRNLPYPYIRGFSRAPGMVAKVMADDSDTSSFDLDLLIGYAPGVSGYRILRRRNEIPVVLDAKKKNQTTHELLGGAVGRLLSMLGGGTIGALVADNKMSGAITGAGAGLVTSELVAGLAALLKKRRTLEEQKLYEESSNLPNYIPGVSAYNQWKNYGVLLGDEYKEARKKKRSESKNKKLLEE